MFTKLGAAKTSAELILPEVCKKCDRNTGRLVVRNGTPGTMLAVRLCCENILTGERAAEILRFSAKRKFFFVEFALYSRHCGTIKVSVMDFAVCDLFGLYRKEISNTIDASVIVEADLHPIQVTLVENTMVVSDGERYSMTRPGSDPSETFAIREYIPGDPVRQIHWKLSQKTDKLMLRELGLPIVDEALLLFETSLSPVYEEITPETISMMAELFLSISESMTCDGAAYSAAWFENGECVMFPIRTMQDHAAMTNRFMLTHTEWRDATIAEDFRAWNESNVFSHIAIVAPGMMPDAEKFCSGNRVSVIAVGGSSINVSDVYCLPVGESIPDFIEL